MAKRRKKKLLDHVRDAIRTKHYSIRTEEAYVNWIRRFILFHDKGMDLTVRFPFVQPFQRPSLQRRASPSPP